MKIKFKKLFIAALFLALPASIITFQSCSKEDIPKIIDNLLSILDQTGWLQNKEDMNNIPEDITPFDDNSQQVKDKVDLSDKFPPIGNQGNYGTCVAWSVGYNLKTALNAIEKGWSSSDLSNAGNQTSPKDVFLSIPGNQKGDNCQGTNFEPALDAIIASGAASMSQVPYTNMSGCSGSKTGNPNNKLANYRKIASETQGLTVENFKGYLNAGRPIAIGAKLGDRFMTWSTPSVLTSDGSTDPNMMHAYHAMVLVGYDDSKQAFRVRNSWGPSWGDNGSIWIGYNYFCNGFCFAAFVAQNTTASIGSTNPTSGYDLLAQFAEDYVMSTTDDLYDPQYGARNRKFSYDVYNSGNMTINPSQRWSVVYMYYNATNADDYQIIFEDYYTDEFGPGDGNYEESRGIAGGFWNNASVLPGKKIGEAEFPTGFEIGYVMPNITGKYYLVAMADGYDKIGEGNEDNNFYFITAANGKPLQFQNGVITNTAKSMVKVDRNKRPAAFSNTPTQSVVKLGSLNAYTPAELRTMLLHDKKTGKLDAKIKAFKTKTNSTKLKKVSKK